MKNKKYTISALFITLLLLISLTAPVFAETDAVKAADTQTIRIVHTNDTHGRYQYKESKGKGNGILGFDRLKTIAKGDQATIPEADLILDAGDTFHGQPFATVEKGNSIAEVMKTVDYTAATPGNHDFNYGKEQLKVLQETSDTPLLSCNIIEDATGAPYFKPSMSITLKNGIKVGLVGFTSPDIYGSTAPANVAGLTFKDPINYVQKEIDDLKEQGCTVIIGLAHVGDSPALNWTSQKVVSATNGLDVVIDGHTHDVENQLPLWKDGKSQALVVQTGAFFENAGVLNLTYDTQAKKIIDLSKENESLIGAATASEIAPDPTTAQTIATIEERQKKILEEVVGKTPVDLNYTWESTRFEQTNLGDTLADAYLAETGADIAFENAGGIRGGIKAGDITKGDIISVAPFGNYVATKSITGANVLTMLETNLQTGADNKAANDSASPWPKNSGSFLQWGGIDVVYNPNNAQGGRVISAQVKGQPLDPEKSYIIATNNFAAISGDYPELAAAPLINEYSACDELLIDYLGNKLVPDWTISLTRKHFTVAENPTPVPVPSPTPQPVVNEVKQVADKTPTNPTTGTNKNPQTAAAASVGLVVLTLLGVAIARKTGVK